MNITPDSSLLRLTQELKSRSLGLRTRAKELSDASHGAREIAVEARAAFHVAMGVGPIDFGLHLQARHPPPFPKVDEQLLAS